MKIIEQMALEPDRKPSQPSSTAMANALVALIAKMAEAFAARAKNPAITIELGQKLFAVLSTHKEFQAPSDGEEVDGWFAGELTFFKVYVGGDDTKLVVGDDERGVSGDAAWLMERALRLTFTGIPAGTLGDYGLPIIVRPASEMVLGDDIVGALRRIWAAHGKVEFEPPLMEQLESLACAGTQIDWQEVVHAVAYEVRKHPLAESKAASK